MVAPCGTRKRFREIFASSLDYMGLVAPEHLSPCRSSMVLAKRETQHIRFTLGGLSLGISKTATTLLVLDEANIVVAQHRSCSHSRHNHNNRVPTVRSRAQQAAQVFLLASQIDAALVLLLFSAYLNACCLPPCVETQIQTPVSIADADRKWGPIFGWRPSRK